MIFFDKNCSFSQNKKIMCSFADGKRLLCLSGIKYLLLVYSLLQKSMPEIQIEKEQKLNIEMKYTHHTTHILALQPIKRPCENLKI